MMFLMIYIYINKPQISSDGILNNQEQINRMQVYANQCLKYSAHDGVYLLGMQGGRVFLTDYLNTYYSDISYSYNNENLVPSLNDYKKELSSYVLPATLACINNFDGFIHNATIIDNSIKVDLGSATRFDVLIKVKTDEFEHEFVITDSVFVDLEKYNIYANSLINDYISDPDWISLSSLQETDVSTGIVPHSYNDFVVSMSEGDFVYFVAIRMKENSAPVLNVSSVYNLEDEKPFLLRMDAYDLDHDSFEFSDDNSLFDITGNGVVSFTPHIPGGYDVNIKVTDSHGNYNQKTVKFIVR